uniref:(northern house mosquito) hypothetical protein n=1 Tax=Culex pipiens TaxID=7175 RepID=A0A8D8FLR8_CULPI
MGPRAHPKPASASALRAGKESGVTGRVIRIATARTVRKVATARTAESAIRSTVSVRVRPGGVGKSANKSANLAGLDRTVRRAVIATWRTRWPVTLRPGSASARLTGAVSAAKVAARWDCTGRVVPRFARVTTIRPAIQSLASASARGAGPAQIVTSPVRMDSLAMAARSVVRERCMAIPRVIT